MNLKCLLNRHDWTSDCNQCARCGITRSNAHKWNGCKCSICGATRHNWSYNCEWCAVCYLTRQDAHQFSEWTCSKCGAISKTLIELINTFPDSANELLKLGPPVVKVITRIFEEDINKWINWHKTDRKRRRDNAEPYTGFAKQAAKVLGLIGDENAIEIMVRVYKNFTCEEIGEALFALGPKVVDPIIKVITYRPYVYGNYMYYRLLGKLRDTRAVLPLIAAMDDGYPSDWESQTEALGQIGDSRAVIPIVSKLHLSVRYTNYQHKNRNVTGILKNLGWEPTTASDRILLAVIFNNWDKVVAEGSAAVDFLMDLYCENLSEAPMDAVTALGQIGDPRSVQALLEGLQKCDSNAAQAGLPTAIKEALCDILRSNANNVAFDDLLKMVAMNDLSWTVDAVRSVDGFDYSKEWSGSLRLLQLREMAGKELTRREQFA